MLKVLLLIGYLYTQHCCQSRLTNTGVGKSRFTAVSTRHSFFLYYYLLINYCITHYYYKTTFAHPLIILDFKVDSKRFLVNQRVKRCSSKKASILCKRNILLVLCSKH